MSDSVRQDIEEAARNPGEDKATVTFWLQEMETANRLYSDWQDRGDKIVDRYLDERGEATDRDFVRAQRRMNTLWANVQTLLPTLIARTPTPNVARANKDRDPVGRYAAMILQRCLAAQLRSDEFLESLKAAVMDLLLPGRGVVYVLYDADIKDAELDADGRELSPETVGGQRVRFEYVHWKNFYTNRARHWGEVWWTAKESFLSRDELRERYDPTIADAVPLDHRAEEEFGSRVESEQFSKATVWQFWDSRSRRIIEIAKDYKFEPLAVREPPVRFDGFWPCPRPLFATLGNKSILPVPDYVQYQDQAEEIDQLTNRIHGLTKALRLRGVYDASMASLAQLFNDASDNELVPVDSFALLSEKGGIEGVMAFVPLKDVAAALMECMRARDDAKKTMYEVTGISDIIRGATVASETATAQQLKQQNGSVRIRDRQMDVARFARDLIRLAAEIIAEQFTQATLAQMSNVKLMTAQQKQAMTQYNAMLQQRQAMQQQMAQQQQQPNPGVPGQPPGSNVVPMQRPQPAPPPQLPPPPPPPVPPDLLEAMNLPTWEEVMALMRNERLRSFVIDVETDSTIEPDQQTERQDRTAFVTAVTQYLMAAEKILMPAPTMAPLMGELLLFAVRGWKIGEQMETKIEEAVEQMEKMAQGPKAPDPKIAADQAKAQIAIQLEQLKGQNAAQSAQMDMQMEQVESQSALQVAQSQGAADIQKEQMATQREQMDDATEREWQRIEMQKLEDARAQREHDSHMAAQARTAERKEGAAD